MESTAFMFPNFPFYLLWDVQTGPDSLEGRGRRCLLMNMFVQMAEWIFIRLISVHRVDSAEREEGGF